MRAQGGVSVWRVRVGIAGRGENRAALDAGLQSLFAEGEPLELRKAILFGSALRHVSVNEMDGETVRHT